ncbi:MAG: type II secretion system protein [Anaeromyxobacter sp.]
MSRRSTTARAFTLLELMVVMVILAGLAMLVVPAVGSITGANARKAAGELAGSMRALFDTAALRHATCRLALDLEHRAYWAECAPGGAAVMTNPDRDEKDLADCFPAEPDEEIRKLLARSKFGQFKDRLVEKRELPGSAKFGEVHVEGRRDAFSSGIAYVYFFPGGQAQRAWVPLEDGKNLYTIVLEPFTGRAQVVNGKVEVSE